MKLIRLERERVQVELDEDELLILNNSLNEVCHGLDLFEFQTRMGAEREQVEGLLDEIHEVLVQLHAR